MLSACTTISRRLLKAGFYLSQIRLGHITAAKTNPYFPPVRFSVFSFPLCSYSSFFGNVPQQISSPRGSVISPFHQSVTSIRQTSHIRSTMDLKAVLAILEQLAPLSLAESWDNVGLLVEPSKQHSVQTILLTNDLTAAVMDEAEAMKCDLIISYHPPLFRPFKRLVQKDWKQQLAIRAVEHGIAVFSPHTSWDSVKGGLNDWLIEGVGTGHVSVLSQAHSSGPQRSRLEFNTKSQEELNKILFLIDTEERESLQYNMLRNETGTHQVVLTCPSSSLTSVVLAVFKTLSASESLNITQVQQFPLLGCGQGRYVVLDEPISVAEAVQRMKKHLSLNHLRLAIGVQKSLDSVVSSVAVCAGSGASVLQGVKADLFITGEMSHHEVLDAVSKGTSVILSEHSNSERGILTVFKERLSVHLPDSVTVVISQSDRDPLQVV